MIVVDERFPTMGVRARILAEYPDTVGEEAARAEVLRARACIEAFAVRLTRFRAGSELSRLNTDPARERRVSPVLGTAVHEALVAAHASGGLVDPTLLTPLEAAGYAHSRAGTVPADLRAALADAPNRAAAHPHPDAGWRTVSVSSDRRTVTRPAGVRLDLGGIAKGLAADTAAGLLHSADRYAVDCGGDLSLGGPGARRRPWTVDVRDPWTGGVAKRIQVRHGGVATSGLDIRLWRAPDGTPRHHLIDPATGAPAWTGVVAATALGVSAVEAETRAKAAFLSGPQAATALLRDAGGALATDCSDGVRLVGLRPAPTVVRLPARVAA